MRKANGIITGKPFSLHRRGRVWYAQFKTPAGIPLLTVQVLIGHAGTDMTRHYHHLNTADLEGVLTAQERIFTIKRTQQPGT